MHFMKYAADLYLKFSFSLVRCIHLCTLHTQLSSARGRPFPFSTLIGSLGWLDFCCLQNSTENTLSVTLITIVLMAKLLWPVKVKSPLIYAMYSTRSTITGTQLLISFAVPFIINSHNTLSVNVSLEALIPSFIFNFAIWSRIVCKLYVEWMLNKWINTNRFRCLECRRWQALSLHHQ